MQFTSKIALLTVALFGVSALALPFALDGEHDVEAREIDNDLLAREFHDMYLEARADPPLNARDFEALEFEARDHLDYLEAREVCYKKNCLTTLILTITAYVTINFICRLPTAP